MSVAGRKVVLFVFGTRPEAIKLAPVIHAFRQEWEFDVRVCVTGQHRELLDQALQTFQIVPDIDLELMTPDQTLASLASKVIAACAGVFSRLKPALVFVQGDTTSAFAAAFAASLSRIPVAHVEAGLRTFQKDSPFPEEINRVLIGKLADLHFAPTKFAATNLRRDGVLRNVHVVGNSIVDALRPMLRVLGSDDEAYRKRFAPNSARQKTVLVTLHRRESFGLAMRNICRAVRQIAEECQDVDVLFPMHPNPRVASVVSQSLNGIRNVRLLDPLSYAECIWLQCRASLVITDSGGVLEEAVTLGVPVLMVRKVTERVEALFAGHAQLLGSDRTRIFRAAHAVLEVEAQRVEFPRTLRTTFGDGRTSKRIVRLTKKYLFKGRAASVAKSVAATCDIP